MATKAMKIEDNIENLNLSPETQLGIQMVGRFSLPMRKHNKLKNHHRFKRTHKKEFKDKEQIKTANYQKACDRFKKNWKKKGIGKAVKIKGEKRPSLLPLNDSCTKSWTHIGYGNINPLKHGMKIDAIWEIG